VPAWGWGIAYTCTVFLQLAVSSLFPPGQAAPDFFLVAAVALGLLRGAGPGLAAGLLLGLTGDLIGGRLVGLGALTLAFGGGLAGLITRRVFRDNLVVVSAIALVLALFTVAGYAVFGWALGVRFNTWRAIVAIGVPVGLYSSVFVPLVYATGFHALNKPEQGLPDRRPLSGGDAGE